MSEDIDLRIVTEGPAPRTALRRLRETVTGALLAAGFAFHPDNEDHRHSRDSTRYTLYQLPYAPVAQGQGALRPTIRIETALWPLRRPSVDLPVASFIAEAFGRPNEIPSLPCVSVVETAADKFVALTRRAGAELAQEDRERDPTLVRHLYDLHALRHLVDPADVAVLALDIMRGDAEAYGNQFPAYRDDPVGETLRAIERLAHSRDYSSSYRNFLRDMVYGDQVDYGACIAALNELAVPLRQDR